MVYFTIYLAIIILIGVYENNRRNREDNKIYRNWILNWLRAEKFKHYFVEDGNKFNNTINLYLPYGCYQIKSRYSRVNELTTINFEFPVRVTPAHKTAILKFVKLFNDRQNFCEMLFNNLSSTLSTRLFIQGIQAADSVDYSITEELRHFLYLSDRSFEEILKICYGSSFPDLATIQLLGWDKANLN